MTTARLGLIAVSGVRIYNDRLTRLGVTLPGFVERARVIASMPSLGLLTIAAVTPAEYDITYLEAPKFDASFLATYDFQAPEFYRRLGFEEVARIADKPLGHTEFVMRLSLPAS